VSKSSEETKPNPRRYHGQSRLRQAVNQFNNIGVSLTPTNTVGLLFGETE
jgi:hypothetical protein